MVKEINYQRFIIYLSGIIIAGSLLTVYITSIKQSFSMTMSEMYLLTETASSLIVRDQRGHEPYMTFKMKCFYCDDDDYGETWKTLTESKQCQDNIFNTCFRNRTVAGRQETHVLALYRYCEIDRCSCTDTSGWCNTNQCGNQIVRCCLQLTKESLLC